MAVSKIEIDDIEHISLSDVVTTSDGYRISLLVTDSLGVCTQLAFTAVNEAELQKLKPERDYAKDLEQTLRSLLPSVLDDNYPDIYKKAVEVAYALVGNEPTEDPLGR